MVSSFLPDKGQDFAADVVGAGSAVGHDALGRGNDGDAEALQHAGQLVSAGVHPQTGLGNAAEAGDDLLLAGEVLEGNPDDALGAVLDDLEGLDIASSRRI